MTVMQNTSRIVLTAAILLSLVGVGRPHPGHTFKPASPSRSTVPGAEMLAQSTQRTADARTQKKPRSAETGIAAAFAPFVARGQIKTRLDGRHFFVESDGIPRHPLMVGITAWQQQVPLPQPYVGDNAWQIPLHPVVAREPRTTKNEFLRGAIAVAVNGIPIFNPLNNRGEDAFLIGELDRFGGHCGRADDYHYHIAPVHLQEIVGKNQPIAYALDGFPIYGYDEPDGSPAKNLDRLNGHVGPDGSYHYHASRDYPYLNGGFYGEVVERDGQVDPQPRARPIRPALPPLRGATITSFVTDQTDRSQLTYEVAGRTGTVTYHRTADNNVIFAFRAPDGSQRSETYGLSSRRPGGTPNDRDGKASRPPKRKQQGRKRLQTDQQEDAPTSRNAESRQLSRAPVATTGPTTLTVSSPSVTAAGRLEPACTCDGAGVSPAVAWQGVPTGTRSLAISLWHTAPDQEKSYWVVTNIPPTMQSLPAGGWPVAGSGAGPILGRNDRGRRAYDPPCSRGPGLKTYHLTVYALRDVPAVPAAGATRAELLESIRAITLATGTLDLQYERTPQ